MVGSSQTDRVNTIDVLNRLVAMHNRSFAVYLSQARPWTHEGNEAGAQTLQDIAADQRSTVDRLGEMILECGGVVDMGKFPMQFTATHDLSLDYLLKELIRGHEQDIAAMEQCVNQLGHDRLAKAAAEQALREANGHLQALQNLMPQASAAKHS